MRIEKLKSVVGLCSQELTRRALRVPAIRYIASNPWSTIAVSCLLGDSCYLGYAFSSGNGVSLIRLLGATSAIAGQSFLLAHGDASPDEIKETGRIANATRLMRHEAKKLTRVFVKADSIYKPIAKSFGMLVVNGVALASDAVINPTSHSFSQAALGGMIALGCGSYAVADLVKSQKAANFLTKLAPTILLYALIPDAVLGIETRNAFILASVALFTVSNVAGYFTHIDKTFSAGINSPSL